jgi:serine/threonine-protein kinase
VYDPGTVVAGKYRIEQVLGRGGMGIVVSAEHLELRARVALKFLADRFVERDEIVERFLREARASAQLRSEHACRVSDVGRLDGGVPYMVMEMLVGRDVARILREDGPLDVATVADYVAQACDAVAEAHALGIVHRDLKPGNLFAVPRRTGGMLIKVLDFGIAKVQTETDHAITSAESVIGSPSYMSPEQLRSARAADARSDIWSLGVILHQALSGRPPFEGETIADLAVRVATEPLPPLVGVPPEFAAVVARCLEKSPAARFQTASELALALAPFIRREPSIITPAGAAMALAQGKPTVVLGPVRPSAPTETTLRSAASSSVTPAPRRRRRLLIRGAVAAIAIGAGLGVLVGRQGTSEVPAVPAENVVTMPAAAPAPPPAAPAPAPPAAVKEPVAPPPAANAEPVAEPAPPGEPTKAQVKPKRKRLSKEKIGASRI